jgi:acylphosphatase
VISAHIKVSGHVQGVSFRSNAERIADRLGLSGWVLNLSNGSVEIVVEGEEGYVEDFIDWCRIGPYGAIVDDVRVERAPAKGEFIGFHRR